MFELNIRFVFHRIWALDIQSIFEFLQLILSCFSLFRLLVWIRGQKLMHNGSVSLLMIGAWIQFPCCSSGHCGLVWEASKSCCKFNKFKLKLRLGHFWYFFLWYLSSFKDYKFGSNILNCLVEWIISSLEGAFYQRYELKLIQIVLISIFFFLLRAYKELLRTRNKKQNYLIQIF